MEIILKKKLTKQEKQKYIYRDKSYDWEDNYYQLIKTYVLTEWSYDKDNRHCLCDNEQISDIVKDDIKKMLYKTGLGFENIDQRNLQNNISKAITKICKENTFSNKELEKEQKLKEKEQNLKELPDKLFKYIQMQYGDSLSYNISNRTIYYNNKTATKNDLNNICVNIKSNVMFSYFNKSDILTVIEEVSKLKSFKEQLEINKDFDDEWNILKGIDEEKWESYLKFDTKNNLIHNTFNYSLFLSYHPQFRNKLSYNLFDKIEFIQKYDKDYGCIVNKPIDDDIFNIIKAHIEQFFGDFNTKYLEPALSVVLQNNSYHEIKRRFKKIEEDGWDGVHRMRDIMIKYFGCEDRDEIREMTEVMLIGSVQRILEERPDEGSVFDYMGIMFGKQGTGKTKFMTRLYFGDKYTSINPDVNDDQKFTDLSNRAWLILFDEMKGIDKADMPTVKSRITEQGINCRLSYGRRSKYYPRHSVFWGNTNYQGVLRDEGEERRFLCFECKYEKQRSAEWWNENYTDYDIDQIWAETLKLYHEKYEGKVPEISKETRDYNYSIQIRHKIWVDDSRTDLEIKEILNYKHYNYPLYEPDKWRIWMKTLDELKLGNTSNHGQNELKFINAKWILSRLPRNETWITGMMERQGWKKIHVNDEVFGDEDYYIKNDLTFEDIKNEYNSYASNGYDSESVPF